MLSVVTGTGTGGRPVRVLVRVLMPLIAGLVALLAPASPARAHAALVAATPGAGSVIGSSPAEVTLTFTEPVTPIPGRTQVLAPDGKRISESVSVTGNIVRIALRRAAQPLGTYLVSYRIVSADSHPVGHALIFSVGAPSARPAETDPTRTHGSVAVAMPASRFLGYAGLTLAIGPALFLALLWPRRLSRRGPIRLVRAGLALVGLATLGAIWTQAPYAGGAPLWDVSTGELAAVLAGGYGVTLAARLAALAAVAALLPPVLRGEGGRGRRVALVLLTLGGLTTWPLTGHAVASPLAGAVVGAGVVHLAAMAVWLGGLATLSIFLPRRAHPRALGVILPAWSRWATLAVVWLAGAGVVQAVVQVGSVPALWQTGYGRLLAVKIAGLAGVLGAATFARTLVRRGQATAAGRDPAAAQAAAGRDPAAGLRRAVGIELAATTVILALSAVLVQVTPGRSAERERTAPVRNGFSQTLTSKYYTLQFTIYPVELGEWNTVHGLTYTPEGKQLRAPEWTITTRHLGTDRPGTGPEPVSEPMLPVPERNDALGSVTFPLPGSYEISFTIRTSDIDRATVRTRVTVPAARSR